MAATDGFVISDEPWIFANEKCDVDADIAGYGVRQSEILRVVAVFSLF